ncbi:MAG: protein translocase subunit SecDF [Prevotellaceae bacterium]|jgi:SecD/SecF fusion protein|nr:protein translocase subunit SecDF [Prevotellaceae bacterium]
MQHKGFVKFFAITLGIICLFYLSFSFVTRYQNGKAEKYATTADGKIDQALETKYLDSISGVKVWGLPGFMDEYTGTNKFLRFLHAGYTYKECSEREISLGLDLKGGMNVTLEISVADILRSLSGNNPDPTFNKAIANAQTAQHTSQKDFLTLFEQEFLKIDPNGRLSSFFSTFELQDKIKPSSSNAEVMKVLRDAADSAIQNSFNVLRSRIDRFGVVQPNIQRLENSGRILVELPGVKERERVRKLLQGTANLEFYETYNFAEIYNGIVTANNIIRNLQENKTKADTTAVTAKADTTAAKPAENDLLAQAAKADTLKQDALGEKERENWVKNNPLFAVLQISQSGAGPIVGYVLASDTSKVNQYFALRAVKEALPPDLRLRWTVKPVDSKTNIYALIAIKGRAPKLNGSVITDASADFSQHGASSEVSMTMNAEGATNWARVTRENIGKSVAIVLDDYVYSYPTVNTEISGGRSQITGHFTQEEAKDLANVLKSGAMPAPARIVQEDVVGPSLGEEAINSGMTSFILAFVLVMFYLIFYYGAKPGLVADFALLANLFFLVGILVAWRATLTLPGIAGIVLTMGMAVDANVLIYERIREELRLGKNPKKAVDDGFRNAFSAILDGNITTLLVGVILAFFGTGPIKGFATTLIIGILTSVFTAVFVTRIILARMADKDQLKDVPFTTKITKNWFQGTKFDFLGIRKYTYGITIALAIVTIVSLFTFGLNEGIEFSGGRNYKVRFDKAVSTVDIQSALKETFGEETTINVTTIGDDNQVRISTNYKIADNSETVDGEIEKLLFNGLKPFTGNDKVTEEQFIGGYTVDFGGNPQLSEKTETTLGIQSSQKVGPSIANDITTAAYWAVFIAIIGIGLYILFRFRNVSFSLGAIASLVNDAILIVCAYSLLYRIMPFSMEVGQDFIAAILTVIGYSINDTVVIFDRIRELVGLYPKRDKYEVINESLNVTLSRTFSTTFSTLLVLIIIFFFGGDVIRGFIFALFIGIASGAYSTLFVATPLAYDIQRWQAKRAEKKAALKK